MVRRGLAVSSLFAWLALPACHTRSYAPDGGLDAAASDAPAADVPGALALDFAVTGCARVDAGTTGDGGAAPCTGSAPLTLTFSPVSSPALTLFRWTFGDDSPPSSDRAPTHTYVLPGTYDVGVVAEGAVGSVSRERAGFVQVTADAAGAPCDVDTQCGAGLFCLCGESAPCGVGFPHGICTRACAAAACGGGAACVRVDVPPRTAPASNDAGTPGDDAAADATVSADAGAAEATTADAAVSADAGAVEATTADAATDGGPQTSDDAATDGGPQASDGGAGDGDARPSDGAADAAPRADAGTAGDGLSMSGEDAARPPPAPLCLATCTLDTDCGDGLVCRTLPGVGGATWANVCVPPLYRRAADSCRDAEGQLDDHVCATGLCADLGAIGLCSASCAAGAPCPPGTACAKFGDGRALCLLTCSASATCAHDPLLTCGSGSGGGALGFTISPPAPAATFCAPRSCTSQADCAPSGTCKPLGVGAHCVAN